jgi:hypothetical protein
LPFLLQLIAGFQSPCTVVEVIAGGCQVIERIGAIVLFGQQVHNFCDIWQRVFVVVNKKTDQRTDKFDV